MRVIVSRLVELAKGGDVRAIKEVLDRTLGRPQEPGCIERLEAIEPALAVGGEVMNLMGPLRAIERRSGLTGPCRSCHGRGGGGWFTTRGDEPAPKRPCPRCGKLGPPSKIIRIVYRSEEQNSGRGGEPGRSATGTRRRTGPRTS